jgi:hypothetical protein
MHQHAAWSVCAFAVALLAAGLFGCKPAAPPSTLSNFAVDIVPGILSHDVVLTNRNHRSLKQVDLTVTVYFEAKVETVTRHWAYWDHEHKQTVNVPASGRIQRIVIAGPAVSGTENESVQLSADWLMKYDRTP